MSELENEVNVVEIYGYINKENKKVYTPNLEFAKIMANKYETFSVFEEKTIF